MSILDRTSLLGFDEWSIYFNMAKHLYPGNFEDCVYRAIGWPQTDAPWVPVAVPQNPLFLNYYDKDVSRLVAGSAELAEIEDTWLQDIKYKKMLRDSIEPKRADSRCHLAKRSFQASRLSVTAVRIFLLNCWQRRGSSRSGSGTGIITGSSHRTHCRAFSPFRPAFFITS